MKYRIVLPNGSVVWFCGPRGVAVILAQAYGGLIEEVEDGKEDLVQQDFQDPNAAAETEERKESARGKRQKEKE